MNQNHLKSKKLLYFIIYWILYGSLVYRYLLSSMFVILLPDILLFIIFFFFGIPKKKAIVKSVGRGVIVALTLFLLIGVTSAFINLVPPLTAFWGFRMFIRYFLLFYFVFQLFDTSDVIKCRKILNQSMLWNFFFCFIQLLQGKVGDSMGGIMSGNGDLSIYIVICVIFLSFDYFKGFVRLHRFLIYILLFYTCSMWAEVKLLYTVIPFIIYASYVLIKKFRLNHIFVLLLSFFFLVPTLKYILSFYYGEQYIEDVFDKEAVKSYTTDATYGFTTSSFNRNTAIAQSQIYYLKDPIHSIIGHGIGSATISDSFGTWIKDTANQTFYYYFTSSYVLIETGWIGFMLFILIYLFIFYRFLFFYIRGKDPTIKYWSALGLLLAVLTFLFIWYNALPYSYWYLPFLVWGFCYVMIKNKYKLQ